VNKRRRRVDWPIILGPLGPDLPVPQIVPQALPASLASLLSVFDELLVLDNPDAILRRAVELARERIGLARSGIFLLDRSRGLMLGTWGSSLTGAVVDEHHVMYALNDLDREAFRRASEEGVPFTVYDRCPIVEHGQDETRIAGRGWVAWTPIRSARGMIGMMFNDAGLSEAPVDEVKQGQAAILCALLGIVLDPLRTVQRATMAGPGDSPGRRLAMETAALLAGDPGISGKEMATRLDISLGRLTRVFKTTMGMSLVEYRNRLRLDRLDVLVEQGGTNLLEAALSAGFGSYAQFHRVFRALRGMTPREYVQRRA
jgi:AraC-like DNA-binding protein